MVDMGSDEAMWQRVSHRRGVRRLCCSHRATESWLVSRGVEI
jgi:hypothetical protein